jgi:hypothetical protein
MPKLTPSSEAVDVWFEEGMILHEDPTDPSQVIRCDITEFEARIDELSRMVERYEEEYKHQPGARIVFCGKREWDRFLYNIKELLREARQQIHVGMPLDVIMEEAQSRQPVLVQIKISGSFSSSISIVGSSETRRVSLLV